MLEGANIKLGSVVTDILGVSGRAMLQALATGVEDHPQGLAKLAQKRLKKKEDALVLPLHGTIGTHQLQMLAGALHHLRYLERPIAMLGERIEKNA